MRDARKVVASARGQIPMERDTVTAARNARLSERIRCVTGVSSLVFGERVQSLWGGYGEIRRLELVDAPLASARSAILKIVTPPAERELGKDAVRLRSHRRKLRSYAVELEFYQRFSSATDARCRVPGLLHGEASEGGFLFVFEDLDALGFPGRCSRPRAAQIEAGLSWLAAFHARFLGIAPQGLWEIGTYWHLATRPDELAALTDRALRRAAPRIDQRLNQARFQTFVHGDAKLENFCFTPDGRAAAAVDFQYVGGGVGVKDVAYFLGSCLSPKVCADEVPSWLAYYFARLRDELTRLAPNPTAPAAEVESEWRELFPWAWVDFHRFMLGWARGLAAERVTDSYSERLTSELLARITVE